MFSFLETLLAKKRFSKRKGPLEIELKNLYEKLEFTESHLEDIEKEFWSSGGVCCPGCGVPGYSQLVMKQVRRRQRISEIEDKLSRDCKVQ